MHNQPEQVPKLSVMYAVTHTLNPRYAKEHTFEQQYVSTRSIIYTILRNKRIKSTFVCEMTKNNDCHYHGLIQINLSDLTKKQAYCLTKYYRDLFRQYPEIGFSCVNLVTDDNGWIEYMKKSLDETSHFIKRPVVMDDYNVFESRYVYQQKIKRKVTQDIDKALAGVPKYINKYIETNDEEYDVEDPMNIPIDDSDEGELEELERENQSIDADRGGN